MSEEGDEMFLILVYIWCGLLSGVWVILAVCTIALWIRVRRVSQMANRRPSMYPNNPRAISTVPSSDYSYGNPTVVAGEELARRGYSAHTPNRSNFTAGGGPPPPRSPPSPAYPPQERSNPNFIY